MKLTTDIINERLKDRGLVMLDAFTKVAHKSLFRCQHGHEWSATPNNVMKGNGCPHCSGRARLTSEIVNERLAQREITLIGEYKSALKKAKFSCKYGHTWNAAPASVMGGLGCPHCASRAKITEEIALERLSGRELMMIGEYVDPKTPTLFRCEQGHEWHTTPGTVFNGVGCPHCVGNVRLSTDIVNERLRDRDIMMISEYITNNTRSLFRHLVCGSEWKTAPSHVMGGTGCPDCNLDGGYNRAAEGTVYVEHYGTFIKVGITNNLEQRLSQHRRANGDFTLVYTRVFTNGQTAADVELAIKRKHIGRYTTPELCPDGHTETFDPVLLEQILEEIKNTP